MNPRIRYSVGIEGQILSVFTKLSKFSPCPTLCSKSDRTGEFFGTYFEIISIIMLFTFDFNYQGLKSI